MSRLSPIRLELKLLVPRRNGRHWWSKSPGRSKRRWNSIRNDWSIGNPQAARSQSPETPKCKNTNSPIPKGQIPVIFPEKLHMQCKKYDTRYAMFEKIKELVRLLKAKKQPGPVMILRLLTSVPSSPKKRSVPFPMTRSVTLTPTKLTRLKKVPTSTGKKRSTWTSRSATPLRLCHIFLITQEIISCSA